MKKYLIPIVIIASLALSFGVYQIPKIVFGASGDTILIESYPKSNRTGTFNTFDYSGVGQTFTPNVSVNLTSVNFEMSKEGSPTGNVVAKLYDITGTYGSTAIPTGSALATSANVDVSSISTVAGWITFTFSGVNQYNLVANNHYAIVVEYSGVDESNYIRIGFDPTGTHGGNTVDNVLGWEVPDSDYDTVFEVYGEPQDVYWSGAGDGYVTKNADTGDNPTDWATIHDGATGSSANYTNDTATTQAGPSILGGMIIRRLFLPFDTSAIPTNALITSATLYFYSTIDTVLGSNDNYDYIGIVQTSQANSTELTTADWNKAGSTTSPILGGQIDIENILNSDQYYSITLNSTGFGWIKKEGETSNCGTIAGVTCLGIREGHDIANVITPSNINTVTISTSEDTSGTKDPFLVVTYTIPEAEGEQVILFE